MDKISGILPEKPRLKTETEVMAPVRPGAPAFGRAEGSAEIRDRVSLSTMKNIGTKEVQNYRNPKEAKNVKIVEELSRSFFMKAPTPASIDPASTSPSTTGPGGLKNMVPVAASANSEPTSIKEPQRSKAEELFEESSELPLVPSPQSKVDSLDYYA